MSFQVHSKHLSMSKKQGKKQSNIGCFIYLTIVITGFIYLPWPIALGFTFFMGIAIVLVYAITNEIRKIRRRNRTNKTLIRSASKGYTELVAKIHSENERLQTWLKNIEADYAWISFQKYVGSKSSNTKGRWVPFFDKETESKALRVSDGSGECWLGLHMVDFRIKSEIERFKPVELLKKIKSNPIEGFPFEELNKKEEIRVIENWIPKGRFLYLYGHIADLNNPEEFLDAANKARRGGDYRNDLRLLSLDDCKQLLSNSQEISSNKGKIIAPNYDANPVEGVIISLNGDNIVNRRSYGAIVAFIIGLIILISMALGIVSSEFPEIFEQLLPLLNL